MGLYGLGLIVVPVWSRFNCFGPFGLGLTVGAIWSSLSRWGPFSQSLAFKFGLQSLLS